MGQTIQVHLPPVQLARHVNDEETLRSSMEAPAIAGFETDVVRQPDGWHVGTSRGASGMPYHRFLRMARQVHRETVRPDRWKVLLEVVSGDLSSEAADELVNSAAEMEDALEVRFVTFTPEVVNVLHHAVLSREAPVACQIFLQEDDVQGHVQWGKRDRLGLPEEIGFHLRLHAFPPSHRPGYAEAEATGRRISTTGWNPLYRGWRDLDLSHVWNVRRQ